MQTAFTYARVSTKEQEEKNLSIPEQFSRIDNFCMQNDITILKEFKDSDSAFHDNKRDGFKEMLDVAIKQRPNYIILDDSSRFSRNRQIAIESKKLLRSHGIEILFANEANIDTSTVAGFWLEGIQEIKNEATSREIAYHVTKGMNRNLQTRDEETGWCYKNGGKAPYGYKSVQLHKGKDQRGKPIYKTIWDLEENTAPIAHKIIVNMFTNKKMSYGAIRDYLNTSNIKNSNGGLWSISTISSMLRIERLEQYNGTAFWNKENKKVQGVKYHDRSKWTICPNAHPKIISDDELVKAIERKQELDGGIYKYKSFSDYLLTDKNFEGNFMFICSECGGHVVGCSVGKGHSKTYSCGSNRYKGKCACINNWKIDKDWLEQMIMGQIEETYTTPKGIDKAIKNILQEVKNINSYIDIEIRQQEKELSSIDNQIQNLLNSIKNGIDPDLVVSEVNSLKKEKDLLTIKINKSELAQLDKPVISEKSLKKYFLDIKYSFENADLFEKKELIKTFIKQIILNKKDHSISVEFFPDISVVQSVGGFPPQVTNCSLSRIIIHNINNNCNGSMKFYKYFISHIFLTMF